MDDRIKVRDLIKQLEKLDQDEYIVVDDGVGNFDNNGQIIIDKNRCNYIIY